MAKAVKRRKGNVISVDFTGVKSGGATVPDGRYAAKISAVEQKEGKESGEPYLELTWEITSKKCNGRELRFDNYSQQPQALWRLKGLLEALEVEVPDGEMDIDFDEIISDETECIVEVTGEKNSEGKTYARVTGHAPLSDGDTVDDHEEEEEDGDKPARGKKPAREEEEEEEPPKRRKAGKKEEEEEEEVEEEEEEEEEEDPPPRSTSKKVKKGAKVKFKDEKNKLTKGTIESIDGDTATVVTDDEDTYEIDIVELTVIG